MINNKYIKVRRMRLTKSKKYSSTPQLINQSHEMKQWLRKHGKDNRISFSDEMVSKLANYFYSLDQDGSNTISANELEDPLILFGLCKNRQEVDHIFKTLDIDHSGELDFKQFLQVFRKVAAEKRSRRPCKKIAEGSSFQDFTKTLLGIHNKIEKGVSFRLGMSIYRRKNMMKAMMSKSPLQKRQGMQIMNKFEQQVLNRPSIREKLKTMREMREESLPRIQPKVLPTYHRRLKTMI